MSSQKMKIQTIFIPMIISFLCCMLACFEFKTDNHTTSKPSISSKTTNTTTRTAQFQNEEEYLSISSDKYDEKGIHQINIEFVSDFPSTSVDVGSKISFTIQDDFYEYIDVFLHLTHSVCEKDIQNKFLSFFQLLEKKSFDELCIHDQFLLYMSIKEGEKIYLQQNKSISEQELQTCIQNMFHPVSFVDTETNYFDSSTNYISVVLPKKGYSQYQERILTLNVPNLSITQYCEIIDITCKEILSKNPKLEGSWNINGYIFKGLRNIRELERIIELHRTYKTSFLHYQNETKQ